jgi:hypothetical protein
MIFRPSGLVKRTWSLGPAKGTVKLTEHGRISVNGAIMNQPRNPLYRRQVISYAVWLHFRFPLSLRMVEEMLTARGIDINHESVRRWA